MTPHTHRELTDFPDWGQNFGSGRHRPAAGEPRASGGSHTRGTQPRVLPGAVPHSVGELARTVCRHVCVPAVMSVESHLWVLSDLASMSGCPTYSLQSVDGDVESHTTEVESASSAGAAGGSGQPPTIPASPAGELLRAAPSNVPQARTPSPELIQVRPKGGRFPQKSHDHPHYL
jgi:hypothetical protein